MNRLRQLREEKEMTQKELGVLLKVQNSAVSKYEIGRISLTGDLIIRICEIFGVSADYLLGITDVRNTKVKADAPIRNTKESLDGNEIIIDDKKEIELITLYRQLELEEKAEVRGLARGFAIRHKKKGHTA